MPTSTRSKKNKVSTPSQAVSKVFGVVELLEMVLIDVPPLQLFVLQRVNQTFRDTIKGSKSLRRKMCIEPSDTTTLATVWEMLSSSERDRKGELPITRSLNYLQRFTKPFKLQSYREVPQLSLDLSLPDQYFLERQSMEKSKCERRGSWKDIIVEYEGDRKAIDGRQWWRSEQRLWKGKHGLWSTRLIKENATFGDILEAAKDMAKRPSTRGLE